MLKGKFLCPVRMMRLSDRMSINIEINNVTITLILLDLGDIFVNERVLEILLGTCALS